MALSKIEELLINNPGKTNEILRGFLAGLFPAYFENISSIRKLLDELHQMLPELSEDSVLDAMDKLSELDRCLSNESLLDVRDQLQGNKLNKVTLGKSFWDCANQLFKEDPLYLMDVGDKFSKIVSAVFGAGFGRELVGISENNAKVKGVLESGIKAFEKFGVRVHEVANFLNDESVPVEERDQFQKVFFHDPNVRVIAELLLEIVWNLKKLHREDKSLGTINSDYQKLWCAYRKKTWRLSGEFLAIATAFAIDENTVQKFLKLLDNLNDDQLALCDENVVLAILRITQDASLKEQLVTARPAISEIINTYSREVLSNEVAAFEEEFNSIAEDKVSARALMEEFFYSFDVSLLNAMNHELSRLAEAGKDYRDCEYLAGMSNLAKRLENIRYKLIVLARGKIFAKYTRLCNGQEALYEEVMSYFQENPPLEKRLDSLTNVYYMLKKLEELHNNIVGFHEYPLMNKEKAELAKLVSDGKELRFKPELFDEIDDPILAFECYQIFSLKEYACWSKNYVSDEHLPELFAGKYFDDCLLAIFRTINNDRPEFFKQLELIFSQNGSDFFAKVVTPYVDFIIALECEKNFQKAEAFLTANEANESRSILLTLEKEHKKLLDQEFVVKGLISRHEDHEGLHNFGLLFDGVKSRLEIMHNKIAALTPNSKKRFVHDRLEEFRKKQCLFNSSQNQPQQNAPIINNSSDVMPLSPKKK